MKSLAVLLAAALLSVTSIPAFAAAGWTDDYQKALAQAKVEKKKVLLDFTGSDWCGWCIKLNKDVFSQSKFKEYARQNLILVEVDFPNAKKLPKHVQEQNAQLKDQFHVTGFPTLVLLDSSGNKTAEIDGYPEGGPDAVIAKLEGK